MLPWEGGNVTRQKLRNLKHDAGWLSMLCGVPTTWGAMFRQCLPCWPRTTITGWWFQTFFIFIPIWGNDPIWLYIIFFRWVETTNQISSVFFLRVGWGGYPPWNEGSELTTLKIGTFFAPFLEQFHLPSNGIFRGKRAVSSARSHIPLPKHGTFESMIFRLRWGM